MTIKAVGDDERAGGHAGRSTSHSQGKRDGGEPGRQGSPERALLGTEHGPTTHVDARVLQRQDSSGQHSTDTHTYENVQSVRRLASMTEDCEAITQQEELSPQEDIPLRSMRGSDRGRGSLGTLDDGSPYPSRRVPPSARMQESTGTLTSCGSNNTTYTMTGTLKRGKRKEQLIELEVQLTPTELERLNRSTIMDDETASVGRKRHVGCNQRNGLHVALLSLVFMPCALLASLCMSFYIGSMCWYNVYLYLSEERTVWHKIFLCPLLILSYPLMIVAVSVGLGLVAAIRQLSWCLDSWLKEIADFEKGFFGWLCNALGMAECSPYEVIVLQEEIGSPYAGVTAV